MRTPLSRRPAPAAELGADQVELAPTASTASFGAYLRYFLGLGTWGFGGPIASVGYMQRDLVERRGGRTLGRILRRVGLRQTPPRPLLPPDLPLNSCLP